MSGIESMSAAFVLVRVSGKGQCTSREWNEGVICRGLVVEGSETGVRNPTSCSRQPGNPWPEQGRGENLPALQQRGEVDPKELWSWPKKEATAPEAQCGQSINTWISLLPASHLLLVPPVGQIQGSLRDELMEISFMGHRAKRESGLYHVLEFPIYCLLDGWSWARELSSLSLGFHDCKVEHIIELLQAFKNIMHIFVSYKNC